MTAIPPTSSGTPAANTQSSNASAGILGKDDFLKLFVAQMQNQDPTNTSQDPSQSMQQMAQFSEVEQITNLVTQQTRASAVGLLGRTVTYTDKTGGAHTGTVEKVTTLQGQSPSLTVAGVGNVDPTTITQVA
jgi:flagellar basal-body rod modification protein FlgD